MSVVGSARSMRLVLLVSALAASGLLAPRAALADGGALGGVAGQVEAVVGSVVQTVPPVPNVGGPTPAPPQGVPPAVPPISHAVHAPPGSLPPVHPPSAPSAQARPSAAGAASSVGDAANLAEGAVETAKEGVDTAAATVHHLRAAIVPSATPDPSALDAPAPEATGAGDPSSASTADPPPSPETAYVPPPTTDGSTGAPLPRWIAYVWPAVALTGPYLANFAGAWGHAILRLSSGASGVSGAEGGVAGVHAAGGRPGGHDSSSSLFSRIPFAAGHAFSNLPTPALLYLGLLVLAVIAVTVAVRREIVLGRRHGR